MRKNRERLPGGIGRVNVAAFPVALVTLPGTVVQKAGESADEDSIWYVDQGAVA